MSKNSLRKLLEIQLSPWRDFSNYLAGMELVSINIDPSGKLYLLAVTAPADYREHNTGVSLPKIITSQLQTFLIISTDGLKTDIFRIEQQNWNYHFVQPLPDNELLLVCARSHYRGPKDYDLNGKVFAQNGTLKREFLLGDGIQDIQTTADGKIWASYFDEGIFGNFGWEYPASPPIGASGLVMWDKFGKKQYEFSPPDELDSMCDCYALNVVSDKETWCYYYTEFPLVCIREGQVHSFWNNPINEFKDWIIGGSSNFVIWENFVLFRGGYRQSDKYQLVELLDKGRMRLQATYRFVNEAGKSLNEVTASARGSFLFLLEGNSCYRVDLKELL
jgi:hypothetical protein